MSPCRAETLPTLDLHHFDGDASDRSLFLEDLWKSARNACFFYPIGHEVEGGLIQDMLTISRRFFALMEKGKLALEMVNSPHFRGYNRAGVEHIRGKPDWREQVDIGPERPALSFNHEAAPWMRLQGVNQSPAAFPEFNPTLLAYQDETTALAKALCLASHSRFLIACWASIFWLGVFVFSSSHQTSERTRVAQ